jgi:chromosome segregation ATPase
MNKFYVILPAILLIVFSVYYTKVAKPEMAAAVAAKEKRVADEKAAEETHRKEIEAKAQEDARKAQEARDLKERERQEKAQKDKEEQDRKIQDETAKFENEAAKYTKQIADMQAEIAKLRDKREAMTREVLDLAKKVELTKIDRRNAELEIQRMYDMVAQKVADSFLTKAPPPPPPK